MPPLPQHLSQLRLRQLGHVARMPDASVVKQLMFARGLTDLPPRARRGAPRKQWFACAMDSLRDHAARDGWYQLAQDKVDWRRLCNDLTPAV